MSDLQDLERIMREAAKRLEAHPDDQNARALFDRTAELFETLWKEEQS